MVGPVGSADTMPIIEQNRIVMRSKCVVPNIGFIGFI